MKRALGLSPWSKCVMSARRETILGSIREARAILRGESAGELIVHVPPEADVKALRRKVRHGNYRRAFDDSSSSSAKTPWANWLSPADRRAEAEECAIFRRQLLTFHDRSGPGIPL